MTGTWKDEKKRKQAHRTKTRKKALAARVKGNKYKQDKPEWFDGEVARR
ncbi:MAG: hypothetical protein U0K19_03975 [Bifidobacteriaceae bacterium]|nr:hypothetical protein [Bifidobacteriaceae bacterium]